MLKNFIKNASWHKLFLFSIAFIFYSNSIKNEFALDDVLVITNNSFVKKGISGIKDILLHDSFYGASGKVAKATGGRYRPLSIVSFAIEKEFFGINPTVFHFFNVLSYALLCLLIYQFLISHIFKENYGAAFLSTLLFAIHPIHTEVVANIKSRDEIYSLLFFVSTLHYLLKYIASKKFLHLIISLFSLAFALLSKEYGVIFILVIPLTIYVFSQKKLKEIITISSPYWLLLAGYLFLRYSVNRFSVMEESDVLNSPYLLAKTEQKFATILWVLFQYIKLLFYPSPLSYDYSYNQIPYKIFSNPQTIISAIFYSALVIFAIVESIKKKRTGYFILLYLFSIFIVSNIFINIGAPMADRFLFGPGLFLILGITSALLPIFKDRELNILPGVILVVSIICVLSFIRVLERNSDWKNNETLYFKDIQTVSNSARALAFCGMTIVPSTNSINDSLLRRNKLIEAIDYFNRAYKIYPGHAAMYQNWGGAYYILGMIDSAEWAWNRLKELKPESKFVPLNEEMIAKYYYNLYHTLYITAWKADNRKEMLVTYREAIKHYDKMPDSWFLLGQLYWVNGKPDSARIAWRKCLQIDPGNKDALELLKNGMQ